MTEQEMTSAVRRGVSQALVNVSVGILCGLVFCAFFTTWLIPVIAWAIISTWLAYK